jgi:predicted transcriptional regulator
MGLVPVRGQEDGRDGGGSASAPALERALGLLGPLEAKIMKAVWSGAIAQPFVVRSVQPITPELAYTTLMTTLNRLADKGVLRLEQVPRQRAYEYRAAGSPQEFLVTASRQHFQRMLERFGDAALTAFSAELGELTPEQRERLRRLGRQ